MSEEEIIEKRKKNLKKKLFGWITDNYDKTFVGILIFAFIIRLLVFFKTYDQAIWWDAADYLATAKRWAGVNPNFIDIWYYRRGFLWPLIGVVFFKTGLGELGIRFLTVLFSTGIVFVSYHLIKKMFNKRLALLVSLGVTLSWVFLFFSGRVLTSLPATFFLLTALLFFWKGYVLKEGNKFIYFFAMFYALAVLTRMQYLMFIIPIFLFIFTKEKFYFLKNKQLWISLLIFFLILTPLIILYWNHFGNPLLDILTYNLRVGILSQTGETADLPFKFSNLFTYVKTLPYIFDGEGAGFSSLLILSPIYILFVIGFFYFFIDLFFGFDKLFKNKKVQKKFFIFSWIAISLLFLGYSIPDEVQPRYLIPTIPFLFLIAIYPLKILEHPFQKKFKIFKSKKIYLIFLFLVILFLFFIPNIKFGKELIEIKKNSYLEVKLAGEWIKEHSDQEDIIISSSLPQIAYYSERSTYPYHLAYRRDLPRKNQTEFYEFIENEKPRYLILSVFEQGANNAAPWVANYPQKYPEKVNSVKIYYQQKQPVLIIYEFNYEK